MVNLNLELPSHFFEQEERSGYLVTAEIKQVWAVELDLLYEFMRVCDKYKIKWFADGGTALGAIRHNGFIPWDNDIDVAMTRKEYDRFCDIAKNEFKSPYFFQTYETESSYHRLHAQLRNSMTTGILKNEWSLYPFNQGIFIDIFPYDNIPVDNKELKDYFNNILSVYSKMKFHDEYVTCYRMTKDTRRVKRINHSVKHMLTVLLFDKPSRMKELLEKYESIRRKYSNIETDRFADMSLPRFNISHNNFFKKEWFSNLILVPFETLFIPVSACYDEYLTTLYGNWHEFVRVGSVHGDTLFDVDRPYSCYVAPTDDFLRK